jgi:hypothetical protein
MSSFLSKVESSVKDFQDHVAQSSNANEALTNPLGFAEKVYGHARAGVIGTL